MNLVVLIYLFIATISLVFWMREPAKGMSRSQDALLSAIFSFAWPFFLVGFFIALCIAVWRGRLPNRSDQ